MNISLFLTLSLISDRSLGNTAFNLGIVSTLRVQKKKKKKTKKES
jgi:hypothetical protein